MFESIYKKRKNPIFNFVGWGLLGLVCLIFIFVGYSPDMSFLGPGGAVAEVNGEPISMMQFQQLYDRTQKERNQKMTRDERMSLQREVIDSLVNRSLIVQAAKDQGIRVSDLEIAEVLKEMPVFQENGKFSLLKYKQVIKSNPGLTEARFEERVATDLLVQKMYGYYMLSAEPSTLVENHEEGIGKMRFNLSFIQVPEKGLVSDAEITQEEVDTFIKNNTERIANYYKANITNEFTQPEQVKAQHILIKITPEFDESKAKAKIEEIAGQITDKNFGDLATKYSEDPGSKNKGGDLGYFGKGRMVPEFEQTAFALEPGKVSEPVKTSFGYHIIKVLDKKESSTQELAQVERHIARKLIKEEKTDTAMDKLKKSLASESEFNQLLEEKKWKWQETGFFSLSDNSIPKIGQNDDILKSMVNLSKDQPLAREPIVKNNFVYIIKLKDVEQKAEAPKQQVAGMDFFKQIMERQKSSEMFQAWMEHLKKDASIKINNNILN